MQLQIKVKYILKLVSYACFYIILYWFLHIEKLLGFSCLLTLSEEVLRQIKARSPLYHTRHQLNDGLTISDDQLATKA